MSDVNPCFSEDIWFEIFKELPVKTLGKCRCVCKLWRSLIVSPYFMASHLKHYTQNDTNSLLLYCDTLENSLKYEQYLFFLNSGRLPLQPCHASICPIKLDYFNRQFPYVVGSIHGLLCLCVERYPGPKITQIMIWNPFIRKIINLPLSTATTSDMDDLTSVLGFGYDSNKNDHRVVKISYSRSNHGVKPLVEGYSVCKRIWYTIPADYFADNSISRFSVSHCFLNGAIHWFIWEHGSSYFHVKWILCFNVVEETFHKIKLPEYFVKTQGRFSLCEYKTKLSVLHCEYTFVKCQIWVKEEESSWFMISSFFLVGHVNKDPFRYLCKDGKLFGFERDSDGMLMFFDVTNRQFIELGHYCNLTTKFATFTVSLVLLDQDTDVNSDDELQS